MKSLNSIINEIMKKYCSPMSAKSNQYKKMCSLESDSLYGTLKGCSFPFNRKSGAGMSGQLRH